MPNNRNRSSAKKAVSKDELERDIEESLKAVGVADLGEVPEMTIGRYK